MRASVNLTACGSPWRRELIDDWSARIAEARCFATLSVRLAKAASSARFAKQPITNPSADFDLGNLKEVRGPPLTTSASAGIFDASASFENYRVDMPSNGSRRSAASCARKQSDFALSDADQKRTTQSGLR